MTSGTEFATENLTDNLSQRLKSLRQQESTVDTEASGSKNMSDGIITAQSSATFKHFVMAGAAAGIMEHCLMYPVDCVKVR